MISIVAELSSGDIGEVDLPNCCDRLTIWQEGKAWYFGLPESRGQLRIDDVHAIMQCVACSTASHDLSLRWRFSSITVPCSELPTLLTRWDETGEPPVLSIIGVDLGDCRHSTRGVAAFIDYEIAAEFRDPPQARDAARNLVRLARRAIMHGLSDDDTYHAADGTTFVLTWSVERSPTKLITISL